MAKTVLIPQTTFTAERDEDGVCSFRIENVTVNSDVIKAVFDTETYTANKTDNGLGGFAYGADYDGESYDFSNYPFRLDWYPADEEYDIPSSATIYVADTNEHTIEVYTGEDEPVVTVQKPGVQVLQLDERLIIFDETTGDIVTFDGENWLLGNDGFGTGVLPSKYAVVGTAIVGKDVVAPSA